MKASSIRSTIMLLMLCCAVVVTGALMGGCAGDDGAAGVEGAPGEDGASATTTETAIQAAITLVTAPSTAVPGTVVKFTLKDQNGNPVTTFPTAWGLSLAYVKLGSDGQWKSYLNSSVTGTNKYTNEKSTVMQATTQANGTVANLGSGNYSYTFTSDKTTAEAVTYESSLTHRIGLQLRGSGSLKSVNTVYDFVPAGGAVTANRKIATTASCKECHGNNFAFHGGQRVEVEHCVTCHNPGTTDPESGNTVNMATMIHKIHRGYALPSVVAGGEYAIWGYGGAKHDYSGIGYPQDIRNCMKCHNGADAATPQGSNWKTAPTRAACGACHDDVNFATGTGHTGGAYDNDSGCAGCHSAAYIESKHVTENATENNPSVYTGVSNFEYFISSVTVTNNTQPVITFQIKKDGAAITSLSTSTTAVIDGFTGSPSFLIAYADGTQSTVDFNNLDKAAAQPASATILNLKNNSGGTLSDPDASGNMTATITSATAGFRVGSKMRTVALQGYFTQKGVEAALDKDLNGDGDKTDGLARHTISVVKTVTGDKARREIVDSAKCAACHEVFEGHGGNRNIDKTTVGTIVCTLCHNPNLTSSGRTVAVTLTAQAEKDKLAAAGYNPDDALTWPEESNNLKDMIHGIHASHKRITNFDFVRNRLNGLYYDFSHVAFPGVLNTCETCHKPGTYDADLPTGVLVTTSMIGSAATTTTAVKALRDTVPNLSDKVTSPVAATCVACHDSPVAKSHIKQNGGEIGVLRSDAIGAETCTVCHGAGRSADVVEMHK